MRQALELALEALEKIATVNAMDYEYQRWAKEHLVTIKEALAQTQEPVAERAWFTIAELNAWADKKLSENPHWVMPNEEPERKEALAQPEQEPVAFLTNKRQRLNIELKPQTFVEIPTVTDWEMPLYMKPQQRTWVGLTNAEIEDCFDDEHLVHARNIERLLKEKNNG